MPSLSKYTRAVVVRILFIATFLLLGLIIANQYVLYSRLGFANIADNPEGRAIRISQLYRDNNKLRLQIDERRSQLEDLQSASTNSSELQQLLENDRDKYKIIIGDGVVEGPGVIIRIASPMALSQVIDFVDALKNSGAEAISINEQRVIVNTPLNQFVDHKSYLIKAIGEKDILFNSLTRPGGIFELIINGTAERSDAIVLPKA